MDLEDIGENVEVIVFPSVLVKYRGIIAEDKIVKVKGKLDKKEDQLKIIANEIEELDKDKAVNRDQNELISERNGRIIFTAKKNDLDKDFINRFYDILKKYPGFNEVEFRITDESGKGIERIFKLPSTHRVDLNQSLKENLKQVFSDKINWDKV